MPPAQLGNGVKWTSNTSHRSSGTASHDSTAGNKANSSISISPIPHLQERKISTPMMPAFMTSAPGKVIVFGEHAVVHGKAAMAASVSLRSYLLVTVLSKTRRTVALRFPDIGFSHVWRIDELPWAIFHSPAKKKFYYDLVTSLDEDLLAAIQPHVEEVSPDLPLEIRKVHKSSATAFLYLFCALGNPSFPGSVYTLRSTIPVGAGLGSSASVAVCLASALLKQLHALSGPHPDQPPDEAALQIERINRWAFVAEMAIHGTPSGVDNTVASGGRAVVFQRKDYAKPPVTTMLNKFPELPLLIVDTKHPKNTAVEVAKVHALRKSQPQVTEAILNAIDRVTESAARLVQDDEFDPKDEDDVGGLGELFQLNHGMLASLGVSHPRLERIKDLVNESELGWTKLTGAGGGGVAITLLKPTCQREELKALESKLKAEDFEIYDTVLGGDGVGILWPAVLHNGSDEEGGEEIDQEKFLRAEGSDELDRLVGVGIRQKRKDWKYWTL